MLFVMVNASPGGVNRQVIVSSRAARAPACDTLREAAAVCERQGARLLRRSAALRADQLSPRPALAGPKIV